VTITALDTFLLLFLLNKGMRKMEVFIIGLIFIIGGSFVVEMFFAKPDMGELMAGFIPSLPDSTALYIAIGIIGATVMPHNLYLHSSLVQSRKIERTKKGIKQALKFNFIDSAIALNLAFFVNAAILILAAAVFHKNGMFEVAEIQDAHALLEPLLGSSLAPTFFAIALIAAGQSSTLTGTLAGQIVMEGHLNLRIQPWVRRLITRMLAIVPALFTVIYFGESGTGKLLVLSQVVLSLQLGFAIIPLIHFVSSKKLMNGFHIKWPLRIASWFITIIIVALNGKLVYDEITGWLTNAENPIYIWTLVIPAAIGAAVLLIYITFKTTVKDIKLEKRKMVPHILDAKVDELAQPLSYKKIAIPVDFSTSDEKSISAALQLGGKDAEYTLIHIVETPGAMIYGDEIDDYETESDEAFLNKYKEKLDAKGFKVSVELGFGSPKKIIPKIVNAADFDLLVLGGHGHSGLKDLLFGTTVDSVRHRVNIPVFIV
ncbi:MAG TPA: divalent metal cation transporter, partial [Aequorivita sp.]|nr:divalent metal cation transporter [Aequorivita sp.]